MSAHIFLPSSLRGTIGFVERIEVEISFTFSEMTRKTREIQFYYIPSPDIFTTILFEGLSPENLLAHLDNIYPFINFHVEITRVGQP